ncbi:MAG: SDR family oxidoreductase [Burkholderiales bacterium]|nr:SDR family oxidoreductase [Burkholderiales bacterium]
MTNTKGYRSAFRAGQFAGRSVVVTGGGSGIGRCTAHELVALGARVALVGRKVEKLEAVRAELGPEAATTHVCDIRDEPAVQATVAAIVAAHGRIDGLVNNAGGQYPMPLEAISAKGWKAVVDNNLTGGFLVARECYKQTMRERGGAIVNIIADMWQGMPGMGHSGAARAGMLNFTETAACEWAVAGVRVNAVAPGFIASSGIDRYAPEFVAHFRRLKGTIPLQRFGNEAEVAAAIVFLLCDAAAFITGSCLRVDGGAPNARAAWPLPAHERSTPFDGFAIYEPPAALR